MTSGMLFAACSTRDIMKNAIMMQRVTGLHWPVNIHSIPLPNRRWLRLAMDTHTGAAGAFEQQVTVLHEALHN